MSSSLARRLVQRLQSHARHVTFDANPSAKYARVGDVVITRKRSVDLLNDPLYNKGSAFPLSERDRLGIRGMVPPRVQPKGHEIEIQVHPVMSSGVCLHDHDQC